jgi:superfamily II DNA or RNA helicase
MFYLKNIKMSVAIDITNLTPTLLRKLDKDLHVKPIIKEVDKYQKNVKLVETFDTFKKDGKTYAALPFNYYYQHLESIPRIDSECEERKFNFVGNLLPRQKEVRDEILDIINRTSSVVLSLHTGFGKTVMAIYLSSKIGLRTVILCHRKVIIEQWVESIKKYIPNATVCILGEKVGKKEMKSRTFDEGNCDFLICNVINVPNKTREFYSSFGLVVVDEIHTVCTSAFSKCLNYFFPEYLIGLSATPFRSDGMDRIIELYCGPEIVFRKLNKPFNVYKLSTNFKPNSQLNISGTLDWNSVLEDQATNTSRNNLIVNLCRYFINRNILVLVKRKDHAAVLRNMLASKGEDVDMFTGDSRECNYTCRVLIATYSIAGVGFNLEKLDLLICAADVLENFTQYIGRIFRRDDVSAIYIDLIDEMSTIKKHSMERMKLCKELGGEVKSFSKTFSDFEEMVNKLD